MAGLMDSIRFGPVRRAPKLTLSADEWSRLRAMIADRDTPSRVRLRARILIQASRGQSNREISRALGVDVATVSLWRRRFEVHRFEQCLRDAPRQGRRSVAKSRAAERVLHATYNVAPPNGQRWTTRSLSRYLGINHMLVHRIWKVRGVNPGKPTSSPVPSGFDSSRPRSSSFVDVLGMFVKPPSRAVVLGIESVQGSAPVRIQEFGNAPGSKASERALVRPGYASAEELMYIIERVQDAVREEGGAKPSVHDLLFLLRELEVRASPSTQVHVITEPLSPDAGSRLAQWLEGHPRFFLHSVSPNERWSDRVRSFLELWHPSSLHQSSFARVPSLALAAIRYAGSAPTGEGLVWSVGSSTDVSRQSKGGGVGRTDISGASSL